MNTIRKLMLAAGLSLGLLMATGSLIGAAHANEREREQFKQIETLIQSGNFEHAEQLLWDMAGNGSEAAWVGLFNIYSGEKLPDGLNFDFDPVRMAYWHYRQLYEYMLQSEEDAFLLARFYHLLGIEPFDQYDAEQLYSWVADSDHSAAGAAMYEIGSMNSSYYDETGKAGSAFKDAMEWYWKSARLKYPEALDKIGSYYYSGVKSEPTIPKSQKAALLAYKLANHYQNRVNDDIEKYPVQLPEHAKAKTKKLKLTSRNQTSHSLSSGELREVEEAFAKAIAADDPTPFIKAMAGTR